MSSLTMPIQKMMIDEAEDQNSEDTEKIWQMLAAASRQKADWDKWCIRIGTKNLEQLESWRKIDTMYKRRIDGLKNLWESLTDSR